MYELGLKYIKTSKLLFLLIFISFTCKEVIKSEVKTSTIDVKREVETYIKEKKALKIDLKFDSLGKKIVRYQDINWDNLALDSLMILHIKTPYVGLKSIKIKRPIYRGNSPFSFVLSKHKKNINLIIKEEGNTILMDSLIFVKEYDSYLINEIYNIQFSHIGSRICTSKIKTKNSYLMLYDSSGDTNCIEKK